MAESENKRPQPAVMPNFGVGMGLGLAFGLIFGTALDNLMLGLIFGASLGYVFALATGTRVKDDETPAEG